MGQQMFRRPPPAPKAELPREAPNRPLGADALSDVIDMLLGGVGVNDPLSPEASRATTLGGLIASILPVAAGVKSLGGALRTSGAAKTPIKAYHGSPHDFDQFNWRANIGQGEGGRTQGAGVNLSTDESYAAAYKTPSRIESEGQGHSYEVKVNASPDEFVEFEVPLSKQPEIAKRLEGLSRGRLPVDGDPVVSGSGTAHWRIEDTEGGKRYFLETSDGGTRFPMSARDIDKMYGFDENNLTGRNLYERLTLEHGGDSVAVSDLLASRGIAGNAYDYRGSRNYVVFDDKLIEILRKYGLIPPAAMAADPSVREQVMPEPGVRRRQPLGPHVGAKPAQTIGPSSLDAKVREALAALVKK